MGTPEFAAVSLDRLYADGHDIAGVITQPDKPRNRGMKASASPVKETALVHATEVFCPNSLRDGETLDFVSILRCEAIVVVAYGKLLPRELLMSAPKGCINIHASLLPKYRGAAPIQWAIMNGETETGVTSMYMSEELDAGDIILSRETPIARNDTAGSLHDRLCTLGAELLSDTLRSIEENTAPRRAQDHGSATFAPPLTRDMSEIDWNLDADTIINKIRGLNPWPAATAAIGGKTCKILSAVKSDRGGAGLRGKSPGDIICDGRTGIEMVCGGGAVDIGDMQAPGGKRMKSVDYLRGHSELFAYCRA